MRVSHWLILQSNDMNSDVNQAKSRAFNVLLRFLQLSLCICGTFFVSLMYHSCIDSYFETIRGVGMAMAGVNLLGLLYLRFRPHHPKTAFLALYALNLAGCLVIEIFGAGNMHESVKCPTKTMLYEFYVGIVPAYLLITVLVLTMPFYWVQRFTNSPGLLVFPIVIILQSPKTTDTFMTELLAIIGIVVCLLTWASNGLALLFGVSTTLKKVIVVCFMLGLALTGINEVLALIGITNTKQDSTKGLFTRNLYETFMLVNLVDILFWLVGILSLRVQNGDSVRDSLLSYGPKQDGPADGGLFAEEDVFPEGVYGTIQ